MTAPNRFPFFQRIAGGVWGLEFLRSFPGGVRMPARGTVVRLADGGLWVHSPTPLSPELIASVNAEGAVRHLVGPNRLHHLSLGDWAGQYPGAKLWAAPGLAEKRSDLSFSGTLGANGGVTSAPVWTTEIEPLLIDGAPALQEIAFFHRASRTLVCTDLLFNIRQPANWVTGVLLTMMGTKGRYTMSRAWRPFTKDRAALKKSVEAVLAWDFVRVVAAHGDVFDDTSGANVRDTTRAALGWALG